VVVVGTAGARTSATRAPTVTQRVDLNRTILVEVNRVRHVRGLRPLQASTPLETAALHHSRAMALDGFFRHSSSDGGPFWRRLKYYYPASGYHSWHVGENLLWMSPDIDAKKAVSMWLNSPEHRKIMLDPDFRELGLSAVHANAAQGDFHGLDVTIVTADFGSRVR
jgi:uncharacterized protein YkwD